MARPRILVSNDDGIAAQGINALADALGAWADVWIVAPDREQSATSHSISLHTPLRARRAGEQRFAIDGTPTDSVYLALHHLLPDPPALVVSGINHGANLGNDVLYSGTVSAAMEGALYGHPAIAVSLCLNGSEARDGRHFAAAAEIASSLAESVLQQGMPPGVLLNVNVPNRPFESIGGTQMCRLGFNDWAEAVMARKDPRGKSYYWIGGSRGERDEVPGSDVNAVADGRVALTPIHYDLTDYRSFAYTRGLSVDGLTACPDALGDGPMEHPVHPRARR